jgi:excisionase family DNA binding protein
VGARMNPEPLWTWREVADYLRASRSWVYKAADAGTLPSLRIGGLLRFDPAMVRAFARGEQPAAVVSLGTRRGR